MSKRKLPKVKTRKEVEDEIKRAEEFAKEHPCNMFGDDNVKKVATFKRICNAYLNGTSLDTLETENNEDANDIEDEEDSENYEGTGYDEEENNDIDGIISWLRGEEGEHYW